MPSRIEVDRAVGIATAHKTGRPGVNERGVALPRGLTKVERFRKAHPGAYALAVLLGCAAVYYVVLEVFLAIPVCNSDTQVRPASGIGPVLGLFFGWPGIVGSALGNLVSDAATEHDPAMLAVYFLVQIAYNAMPYLVWYISHRTRAYPYPRLDSTGKVVAYLVVMLLDAVLVTVLLMPLEADTMQAFDIHLVRVLNNVLFLVYLGIPVLLALEFSPLVPLPPRFIRAPYAKRRANLTQMFVMLFTFLSAVLVVLFIVVGYGGSFMEEGADYAQLIGSVYITASLLSAAAFIPMLALVRYFERSVTRPIEALTESSRTFVARVAESGDQASRFELATFDGRGLKPQREVRDLFASMGAMQTDLVEYLERLASVTADRERATAELDIARKIQMDAVPHDFTSFIDRHHMNIAALMRPAREVGGDFYDVFDADDHRVAFVVGDVSGKGVPAALFMMRAQSLIKECLVACEDVGTAFALANRRLCERNDAMLFVTAFACVLDVSTGCVSCVNAGHNPPSVLREGRRAFLRFAPGLVLGVLDSQVYHAETIDLKPGDGLLLYTDGVTEACDATGALYGEQRLADVLDDCDARGDEDLPAAVLAGIDAFAAGAPQADDITLLAFSWNVPVERLALPPEERCLDDLFAFLGPLCDREGCTARMLHGLMLVCEEVFVNICHYGFPDGQRGLSVVFEAAVDEANRTLHLTVSDQGIAYNPLEFEAEIVDAGRDNDVGGLGIFLVRQNVDHLSYERKDGKNILRMAKRFV